jgi:hypothetical protein
MAAPSRFRFPWDTRYKTQSSLGGTGLTKGELSMKTILVAYDDTDPSRRALERTATR